MQYAQVAVDTKTSLDRQSFTYQIPPELLPDIKLGVLVLVPFHGRKIQGVIVSLKHLSTGTFKHKLKTIIKIIGSKPVLDDTRLELAKWMGQYYLTPIGEVIFAMIPPVAIRQIRNDDYYKISKLGVNQISQKNAVAFFCDDKKLKNIYTFYNRIDERVKIYLKLINKSIAKNKNCLVLFPNIEQAKEFNNLLLSSRLGSTNISSNKEVKSVIYHSDMTKTQRYNIWNDVRNNKYQVVIGTRPTIFVPINNLGLIIIDQSENFGYKEEQNSKYHSLTVAKKLSQITGSNLVLGDLVPSVENYYFEQTGKYLKLQNKPESSATRITTRIIDLNTQKNKIISWELEESVKSTIDNNGKILLFALRKGEGSCLICNDCGHIFKCDKCDLPYSQISSLKSQISNLVCYRCNTNKPIPKNCPNCHGIGLKSLGLGVDKIQREISILFPNVKSIIIDVDSDNINDKIIKNQVIIATKKISDDTNARFDLVGIINLDNLLNLPDFKIKENIYLLICNLVYKCSKQFILQTYSPDNDMWNFISHECPHVFLTKELLGRKESNFPPYSQLVKLIYQNESKEKCIIESQNLKSKIINLPCRQAGHKLVLLGPAPCFITKVRNKYQYQIIIFTNNYKQKQDLTNIISNLSKGWKIDVDPISLI